MTWSRLPAFAAAAWLCAAPVLAQTGEGWHVADDEEVDRQDGEEDEERPRHRVHRDAGDLAASRWTR
jgi:hypothetical protein